MMPRFKRFVVWSNVAYLVPLAAAAAAGLWVFAVLLGALFITSTGYHFSNERKFIMSDQVSAYAVIAYNLFLLFSTGFPVGNLTLALVLLAAALYFRYVGEKKNFDLSHGLWHISCASITLACISAYALPF